jgi:phage tail sheath protein FI
MNELTGAPKTVINVSDQSLIIDTPVGGIICVQGVTRRGKPGEPEFVGNTAQFRRKFGGYHPISNDPLYFMRLLDAGVKLWISRVSHYADVTDKGSAAGTKATGTLTVSGSVVVINAEAPGDGYNGTTIQIKAADSGNTANVDLIIKLPDSDIELRIYDVKKAMTVDEIDLLNKTLPGVNIASITTAIPVGTVTLAGGVEDITAIDEDDYIGDTVGKTGWFSFGKVKDAFRIANISKPVPAVDAALSAYVASRKDMRFHTAPPVTATAEGIEDYRLGTGAYSHTPIDNWMGNLIAGGIEINHPTDSKKKVNVPGIVDALPLIARKDVQFGPWFSAGGTTRGLSKMPNNGVIYNLADPDNAADFDRIYGLGVNAMVDDESYGTMYFGNRSLSRNKQSLLSKDNVADLVVYVVRGLKPLVKPGLFEPNDPQTWKRIYRNVRPFIETLETGRAIRPGEGSSWFWIGDQDKDRAEEAAFNTQTDLQAGKYVARFMFVPIGAIEFIGIDVTVTDSNSLSFNLANL